MVRCGVRVVCAGCVLQTRGWEPSAGHTQIAIWPGTPPDADAEPAAGPESAGMATAPIAGKLGQFVEHVSRPTMTVYSPTGRNTGVAVIVFPGGGYQELAIDLEGTEVVLRHKPNSSAHETRDIVPPKPFPGTSIKWRCHESDLRVRAICVKSFPIGRAKAG